MNYIIRLHVISLGNINKYEIYGAFFRLQFHDETVFLSAHFFICHVDYTDSDTDTDTDTSAPPTHLHAKLCLFVPFKSINVHLRSTHVQTLRQ